MEEGREGAGLNKAIGVISEVLLEMRAEKKQKAVSKLERVLEGSSAGGSGEAAGSSSSRKNAAQMRELKRALIEAPEELADCMWKLMGEDFSGQTLGPGEVVLHLSSRGWLEHRSRVQNFPATVRWLWGVAGMVDALRAGKSSEALSRGLLLLAQGDQVAIDNGSWVVAQEMSLEAPPPFAAFSRHVLPERTEPQHSRIVDARWMELFMNKISDLEAFQEKKKKLGGGGYRVETEADRLKRNAEDKRKKDAEDKRKADARKKKGDGKGDKED